MNKVRLTIGDWSGDGHEVSEDFIFESNKNVEEIRQAYKDSCKLTGLSFNHNEDYTGLKLGYDTERQIATEYEECTISKLAVEILLKHGIDVWKDFAEYELDFVPDDDDFYIEGSENFVGIWIAFVKLSLPDLIMEEASFKRSELSSIPVINGWWNDSLNCQFGYGLYE